MELRVTGRDGEIKTFTYTDAKEMERDRRDFLLGGLGVEVVSDDRTEAAAQVIRDVLARNRAEAQALEVALVALDRLASLSKSGHRRETQKSITAATRAAADIRTVLDLYYFDGKA